MKLRNLQSPGCHGTQCELSNLGASFPTTSCFPTIAAACDTQAEGLVLLQASRLLEIHAKVALDFVPVPEILLGIEQTCLKQRILKCLKLTVKACYTVRKFFKLLL